MMPYPIYSYYYYGIFFPKTQVGISSNYKCQMQNIDTVSYVLTVTLAMKDMCDEENHTRKDDVKTKEVTKYYG